MTEITGVPSPADCVKFALGIDVYVFAKYLLEDVYAVSRG
jgi:hypothetical protein